MAEYKEEDTKVVENTPSFSEEEVVQPEKSYVPEGFSTVEEYLEDMRETYRLDLQADEDNRKAALEDKKFVAGEQWDPRVLEQRAGLPCLVINSIPQFTAQLVGDWRTNRTAVKVIPSEGGDRDVASIRSDLIRAIEQKNRASRVYDNTFESMVQCGDGAFRVGVKYANEDVFDQEITVEPIDDVLSVVWDRLSIDNTGRDATHVFIDDTIPEKEFKAHWGEEADPSTLSDDLRTVLYNDGWCDRGTVKVTEHWRMIERKKMLVMFEDGTMYPFSEETPPEALEEYTQKHGKPIRTRISPCRYAQMHLVTGFQILAGPYEYKMDRLPIIRMMGRVVTVGDRRMRYGLVRYMKDPARLRNFWRSVAAEQLGYAPKAQWLATESAIEGREDKFRSAHKNRDPLLVANDEAEFGKNLMRIDPPPIQMALLNEAQVNTQDMKDVTGIHDASLGIKSNETSGRAINARQREGDIASLTYYDNGNASIMEAGDVINQLIPQIYDATRVVRIIGEDESARLITINDPMNPDSPDIATGKYDVTVTTGASYTTRRVEAAEAMMEAVQVFPELMQVAGDLVAKAQDWPGAEELAERLRKTIPPQLLSEKERKEMGEQAPDVNGMMQQQAQMQEAMAKGAEQLQKLEVENAALKARYDIEQEKLRIDHFKAETDRLKVLADVAIKDKEFDFREIEHEAEIEQSHIDRAERMNTHAQDREDKAEDRKVKAKASPSGRPQPKSSK